uniref:Estradiol 17-beta-dehydrogenase 8 (inferred by orthology to a human protein) n=1 Tax=Anisakis simplex TaxID=6269 RepID=A0A0M3J4V1_ANISI
LAVENGTPQSVINLSSIVAKTGNIGQANYAASKAGVIAFTKSAAKELALKGVRLNAVLPGFITSQMTNSMPEKVRSAISKQIPMGREGRPNEIADVVVFLASDWSSYITGATIEVTGGLFM